MSVRQGGEVQLLYWEYVAKLINIDHFVSLKFKSTREPVKVLGIFLGYNQDKIIEENFLSRIRKMKTRLNLWLSRDLTLYGKSLLAKTLGVSQLVYAASLLSVPNAVIKIIQTELFSFLWKNKKDKIKRAVL